ncbi:MAG: hypothetical protein Q9206_003693 [Seirophora lacunosa]
MYQLWNIYIAAIAAIAPQISTPAAHRRSAITNQLYQFALGYPPTPPDISPLSDPITQPQWGEQEAMTSGMGSFVFRWDHPATEVYVTGTFDDWGKSVKLEKEAGGFVKRVDLPLGEKIYYKFVVDGNWTTDHTAPQEEDSAGNVNNILTAESTSKSQQSSDEPASAMMSGVSADSTTAQLAGQVPKEDSSRQTQNDDSASPDGPGFAMISGASADSTTAQLAGQVPKESSAQTQTDDSASSNLPGTFPQTPAKEVSEFSVKPMPATSGMGNPIHLEPGEKVPDPSVLTSNTVSSTVKDDPSLSKSDDSANTFGVAPLPATSGMGNPIHLEPGEKVPDPSSFTSNTVSSTVKDDPSLAKSDDSANTFGVAPLPATSGIGNPIHLEPGEKVPDPSSFTSNTIDTHVRTDKESYEKGSNAPQLPDVVTPQKERDNLGASMFSVPGISNNMIPESSLPMGDTMPVARDQKDPGAIIQSAGAESSTAALAGLVPKEPTGVPQIVQESQNEAGVDAEASHSREAVQEKSDLEKELGNKVSVAPPTSEGIGGQTTDAGSTAAGAANAPAHGVPPSIQQSIDEMNKGSAIAPTVPDVVQESIAESNVSPEAAGDKTMIGEKSAMEDELLKKVPVENAAGQPAPVASASLAESAPAPTDTQSPTSASTPGQAAGSAITTGDVAPTASTSNEHSAPVSNPVDAPAASKEPPPSTSPTTSKGAKSFPTKSSAPPPATSEPAATSKPPMTTAAAPASTPATEQAARKSSDYSREVSPMTKTGHQTMPTVTTGIGSSSTAQTSESTPAGVAASPKSGTGASTDKKSKRASGFFGRIKAKFSDKDKDKK